MHALDVRAPARAWPQWLGHPIIDRRLRPCEWLGLSPGRLSAPSASCARTSYSRLRTSIGDVKIVLESSAPLRRSSNGLSLHRPVGLHHRRPVVLPATDSHIVAMSPLLAIVPQHTVPVSRCYTAPPRCSVATRDPRCHPRPSPWLQRPTLSLAASRDPCQRSEVFRPSPRHACCRCIAPSSRNDATRGPLCRLRISTLRGMHRIASLGVGAPLYTRVFVTLWVLPRLLRAALPCS